MGLLFRPIEIIFELAILMGVIYSLFAGITFTAFDLGLNQKYRRFIKVVLMILGCLALVFFVAHLIAFYPRLSIGRPGTADISGGSTVPGR